MKFVSLSLFLVSAASGLAQSISVPWSNAGHDAQHSGISRIASQAMGQIKWQMSVDLMPQYSGGDLLIHYGSPVITRNNTVIVPVKTGADDGFKVEGHDATNGNLKWTQVSDYLLPPHYWVPPFGITLTPKNRVYLPGIGGKVYFRDSPDATNGATGEVVFYGAANYQSDPTSFNSYVKINTPITSDRYGNIYFGFEVSGATTPALSSGIARIAEDGTGSWRAASFVTSDGNIVKVADNCAPALSNDHKTLYFAARFSTSHSTGGYLVAVDSRTLIPVAKVRLRDVVNTTEDAYLPDDSSASPTVGPDGDVYFGVLESSFPSHNDRGWLLHFNAALTQTKTPGSFGWDDTASIVPAAAVPSYHGASEYLLLTKYNNYAGIGSGDGVNKLAVIDPGDSMNDPVNGNASVMKDVLTVTSPTPDEGFRPTYPNALREWCINMAVVDPITKSAIVSCEDGKTYRWDFATNSLSQVITLTNGTGEAYTPTLIGMDGTIYAIANGTLFAIGGLP